MTCILQTKEGVVNILFNFMIFIRLFLFVLHADTAYPFFKGIFHAGSIKFLPPFNYK